jgi:hypothetical protein
MGDQVAEGPIESGALGYALCFVPWNPLAELAVISALNGRSFSGRCECYRLGGSGDGEYFLGLALRHASGEVEQDPGWWESFAGLAASACEEDSEVAVDVEGCRPLGIDEMRSGWSDCGAVEFAQGVPVAALAVPGSWFCELCIRLRDEGGFGRGEEG